MIMNWIEMILAFFGIWVFVILAPLPFGALQMRYITNDEEKSKKEFKWFLKMWSIASFCFAIIIFYFLITNQP